jgi:RNA polymerase sigma-70 factor (ECF subfamily)
VQHLADAAADPVSEPDGHVRDRTGFERFVRHERRALLALAFALCSDRGVAEDLVQDALLEAYRRWDRIAGYDDPAAWARRVVVTRATSRWRRNKSELRALERFAARTQSNASDTDAGELFWTAVRTLPERQAQMVVLRYVDDLDVAAIARVMECAEGTVKATLHQARRALSTRLSLEDDDA